MDKDKEDKLQDARDALLDILKTGTPAFLVVADLDEARMWAEVTRGGSLLGKDRLLFASPDRTLYEFLRTRTQEHIKNYKEDTPEKLHHEADRAAAGKAIQKARDNENLN